MRMPALEEKKIAYFCYDNINIIIMRKHFVTALAMVACVSAVAATKPMPKLTFDASKGVAGSVTMPQGQIVHYTAYTNLYYVTHIEDSTYQYMNVFVPQGADQHTPIFMRNYVGGYMASKPQDIDATDASGRALAEGYVVVIPGARGRNSAVTDAKGNKVYTGRAPRGLLDLKAAVRYLRLFDKEMPGDAERIITDGTSAGGAMSSLLGATGNHPAYADYLKEMGAADTRDDIYAAVCYCPIIDLDHADMAYEWLYGCTNNVSRPLTDAQVAVSKQLAALYPDYLASLNLKDEEGHTLNADNYLDYLKKLLVRSAQEAKDAGATIPDSLGFTFSGTKRFQAPVDGVQHQPKPQPEKAAARPMRMPSREVGEYVLDVDLPRYLNYVVSTIALKTPPAFDSQGVAGARPSPENEEFGDAQGSSVNFTDYSLSQATGNASATIDEETREQVRIMNPMNFIRDSQSSVAPHWYIRHGARDRDTAFPVPINLALMLRSVDKDVDFKLPWNRPHSGDYALDELFRWIKQVAR